jgi:hypothetical protein
MLQPTGHRRRKGFAIELRVGERLALRAPHGTGELGLTLDAKDVELFLQGAPVDTVEITLTISRRSGQRANVQVQAPDRVRVLRPDEAAI